MRPSHQRLGSADLTIHVILQLIVQAKSRLSLTASFTSRRYREFPSRLEVETPLRCGVGRDFRVREREGY
jgi:hypothetical protein